MASIIQVEELRGLTSGANANTVSMGSGQQFMPSPNQVIQYKFFNQTTTFDSSSGSYVNVFSQYFTPKQTGSQIVARYSGHLYKYNSTNFPNTQGKLLIDNTQVWQNNYITYHETDQYMYTLSVIGAKLSTGTSQISVGWQINPNGYRTYIYANTGGLEIWEVAQ